MIEYSYAISWFIIIEIIGFITFPIISLTCGNLNDKGYSFSKILGIVFLTFITWLFASLHILKFGWFTVVFSLLILLLIMALLVRNKKIGLVELFRDNRHMILKNEFIFLFAFVMFLLIQMNNPNIFYAYSEDFMDYGFIKAILRSEYFPPADPWYAGSTMTYYYGGHLIMAILILVSGVPPYLAYTIGGAMFFALTVLTSYGLGCNLTNRSLYGLLTAMFVAFIGFFSGFLQLLIFVFPDLSTIVGYRIVDVQNIFEWFVHYPFYEINRIIPYSLIFYPAFVFLQGDLHGHMISIPFQVAFLSYIYGSVFKRTDHDPDDRVIKFLGLLISGIFLGFFLLINTWNYPTFVIFTGVAIVLVAFQKGGIDKNNIISAPISRGFYHWITIVLFSVVLYSPYLLFSSSRGFHGIGILGGKTQFADFLEIFALFIFVLSILMWWLSRNDMKFMIRTVLISFILAVISGFHIFVLLFPIILMSVNYLWKNRGEIPDQLTFILLLTVTGAFLALFCDLFYINDSYGHPYHRMNTLLKITLEIWIFLGIAAANSLYFLFGRSSGNKFTFGKSIGVLAVIVLIVATIISPLAMSLTLGSGNETLYGIPPGSATLNGLDYLFHENLGDYMAILWIEQNVAGNHVMVEAPGMAYTYSSRISSLTGLSTIIGWTSHERMWRGKFVEEDKRINDTDLIYNSEDNERTLALLDTYAVEYIYIGEIEQQKYSPDGLQKFSRYPQFYELIYESEGVSIYKVK